MSDEARPEAQVKQDLLIPVVMAVGYLGAQLYYHPIQNSDAMFVAALLTAVTWAIYRLVTAISSHLVGVPAETTN